jgi:tetraacyldisaccharide 4'-kinase
MNLLRKMLFPIAVLYGFIMSIRNFLFDKGFFKSYAFDLPIIAVGNLSVGGTGKTPQIEYLIGLLSDKYKTATLSRGYKRKSKGFILANATSDDLELGDEPFQFFRKFKNILVAVDVDRRNGIIQLLSQFVKPDVILLDDAFQHRKVKAGFYILLTSYGDLYSDDFILPTGNLRESRSGAERANIIIVTKCPPTISVEEQNEIKIKLKLSSNQNLFFTFIEYEDSIYSKYRVLKISDIQNQEVLLLAGIAKPESFFSFLKSEGTECLTFADHHQFNEKDILDIKKRAKGKIIITTEKDFVRLKDPILESKIFYLPIKSSYISGEEKFNKIILDYVGSGTRNS